MVDRTVATRLVANNSNFDRAYAKSKAIAKSFADELDSSNDRMTNLIQTGLALGPALVPTLAAGGAAALALGSGLAAAATGAGVAALAFNGIGDALDAVNTYQLDPTVENLDKAREALRGMSPAGAEFVGFLQNLRPKLQELQRIAQTGLLPGVQEGIDDLMSSFPIFERIVGNLSSAMGRLSADAGQALSGPFWDDFFDFIATEGPRALDILGRSFGNLVTGVAGVAQAFGPLSTDIMGSLLDMSESFKQWGTTLDTNEGFREFIDYVRSVGPQAFETLGALANALIQLVQAAAPVGQAVLPVIELLANGLATIADSPVGPVLISAAAGLAAISRAIALYNVANGSALMSLLGPGMKNIGRSAGDIRGASAAFLDYGAALDTMGGKAAKTEDTTKRLRSSLAGIGKAGAGIAGMTLLLSDFDDGFALSNTAALGLTGTMAGPWGAALGAAAGFALDLTSANDELAESFERAGSIITGQPTAFAEQAAALAKVRTEVDNLSGSLGAQLTGEAPKDFAELSLAALEIQANRTRQAVSDLSQEFGRGAIDLDDYETLEQTVADLGPAFQSVGMDVDEYVASVAKGGIAAVGAVTQFNVYRDAIARYQAAQDSAAGRSQGVLDALAGLDDQFLSTAASAKALSTALEELLGPGLNLSEAQDAWTTSLRTLREELNKNNRTLVGNSNAAIQNREAIRGRVTAMVDLLNAEAAAGTSASGLSRILERQRGNLLDAAAAAGVSRQQLRGYLREIGFTPKLINTIIRNNAEERQEAVRGYINTLDSAPRSLITTISQPGFEASEANIERLAAKYDMTKKEVRTVIRALDQASGILGGVQATLDALDGKTATTYVNTIVTESRILKVEQQLANADGNVVEYASGGVHTSTGGRVARVPQIVKGRGAGIRWGEAETGWEAYISGKPGMRERNRGVLNEAARRLGMDRQFADGDITGKGPKPLTDKAINATLAEIRDQFGKRSPLVDAIRQWLEGLKRGELSQKTLSDRIDKALAHQITPALREFNVGPRQSRSETRGEFQEMLRTMRETFGPDAPVVSRIERLGGRLLDVAAKQDRAAARYERANDKLDKIVDRQRDFASEVRQAFTHDAFGGDIDSVAESMLQIRADANDASRANRQLHRLGRKGLNDAVLRQVAASGNTALIAQLSRMTPQQLNAYERAFGRRNRELRQLGRFAGRRVFGDEVRAQTRVANRTERTLRHLNRRLGHIERDIERGAERGVRRGMRDRRSAQTRRRRAGAVR